MSARLQPGTQGGAVVLQGNVQNGPVRYEAMLEAAAPASSGVATRWGRARVDSLMQELHAGGEEGAIRDEIIAVARAFHIVTRYTSLVAAEEFPTAVDAAREVRVPGGGALPRGGTTGKLMLLLAALLMTAGGTLFVASRPSAAA